MHRIIYSYENFRLYKQNMVLRDVLAASDDDTDNDEARSEVEMYPLFFI